MYVWTPKLKQCMLPSRHPCCCAASILPPWNSRCKIELIFGVRLQFNVVWCIRSRREIVLTIQSDNGKQGYKVGGKKYRRPKVVFSQRPLRTSAIILVTISMIRQDIAILDEFPVFVGIANPLLIFAATTVRAVSEIILGGGPLFFSDPSTPRTRMESEPPDPQDM